ncbi:MAG: CHAT domain-containing protein [Scytonema sp. RU_4_4]|nr:CHAT domain-containing protein [Scytonema sp. RU_4_4]
MKKILIVSANPKNTNPLRLGEEARRIQEALKLAKYRDQFEIATEWAVRVEDLRRAMLDHQPHIVHFSGHGAGTQGLALEDNSGVTQLVSSESLTSLFELFRGTVECVLLNACYSEVQAQAIHRHIDYVIGMNQPIGDVAAIEFATGFYDALGAGENYDYAFSMGRASIHLKGGSEYSTPVLKSRPSSFSVSAKKSRKLDTISEKELQQKPSSGISSNISDGKIGSGVQDKDLIKVGIGVIFAALIGLLLTFSSVLWKLSQKEFKLDCITQTDIKDGGGPLEVKCPAEYILTGGGVSNFYGEFTSQAVFEKSFPKNENTWECDIGAGYGYYSCYVRCCKVK